MNRLLKLLRYVYKMPMLLPGQFLKQRSFFDVFHKRNTQEACFRTLKPKNASCSGDCCRLCGCPFKVQIGDKIKHISTENLLLSGKKGIKKRPLDKLLSEDLGLPVSNNRPFPHSSKQWHRVEVRMDKNTAIV